jgi:hypothetical protein
MPHNWPGFPTISALLIGLVPQHFHPPLLQIFSIGLMISITDAVQISWDFPLHFHFLRFTSWG